MGEGARLQPLILDLNKEKTGVRGSHIPETTAARAEGPESELVLWTVFSAKKYAGCVGSSLAGVRLASPWGERTQLTPAPSFLSPFPGFSARPLLLGPESPGRGG